ncbi:hypothetical protein EAS64_33940 [Trebonia kvetii]|uniref:Uncharacterized protein n=1 Tax=Trebonia kvetii TaxID=2480626 RepID=A0A6P2BVP7_9ACTN|nr:hypothetical protein [Trebonia kvetii]TVZ01283.1 hypothetical protein EAS64_33940 [Trebonia kvetii]
MTATTTARPEAYDLAALYQEKLADLMWVERSDVTPVTVFTEEGQYTHFLVRMVGYIKPDLTAPTDQLCRTAFYQRYEIIIKRLTDLRAPFSGMPTFELTGLGGAKYWIPDGYLTDFGGMKAKIEMQFGTYR